MASRPRCRGSSGDGLRRARRSVAVAHGKCVDLPGYQRARVEGFPEDAATLDHDVIQDPRVGPDREDESASANMSAIGGAMPLSSRSLFLAYCRHRSGRRSSNERIIIAAVSVSAVIICSRVSMAALRCIELG
jgi:hypothetical protein